MAENTTNLPVVSSLTNVIKVHSSILVSLPYTYGDGEPMACVAKEARRAISLGMPAIARCYFGFSWEHRKPEDLLLGTHAHTGKLDF